MPTAVVMGFQCDGGELLAPCLYPKRICGNFPEHAAAKPCSINVAGFSMWDRMTAHCVPLTSLGNQIPSHHFSPLLRRNC